LKYPEEELAKAFGRRGPPGALTWRGFERSNIKAL
jgi:hypothetical protein